MAQRSYKSAQEAAENWIREFKPSGQNMTVKQTEKLTLDEAVETFGTKKNYAIINKVGTEPRSVLEGGHVVAWTDAIQIFYRSTSDSRSELEKYLGTPFTWHDAVLLQWRKCTFNSIEDTENEIINITIEVK